jgi:hypothetical protein
VGGGRYVDWTRRKNWAEFNAGSVTALEPPLNAGTLLTLTHEFENNVLEDCSQKPSPGQLKVT